MNTSFDLRKYLIGDLIPLLIFSQVRSVCGTLLVGFNENCIVLKLCQAGSVDVIIYALGEIFLAVLKTMDMLWHDGHCGM